MILNMLECHDMLKKYNICFMYCGPVWAAGIEGIAGTLRERLACDELPLSAYQSVFSVFVEQMNNISMYSAEKERFNVPGGGCFCVSKGVFILGEKDKTYFMQSGNVIKRKHVGLIKSRIDHLNTLDKAGLRRFYKERIKQRDTNEESKGAGLGLIEIARRASSKIEYTFTPLDDTSSFFTLLVYIGQGGN